MLDNYSDVPKEIRAKKKVAILVQIKLFNQVEERKYVWELKNKREKSILGGFNTRIGNDIILQTEQWFNEGIWNENGNFLTELCTMIEVRIHFLHKD